ncbi:MAG: AmmeMemoRadiSam system protein B [Salinivirgaceae bacterium]
MKIPANRKPVVNGLFYPDQPEELQTILATYFMRATKPSHDTDIRALIVPHAGYNYSGEVAAQAYQQLNANQSFENVFILAPSHHVAFNGASVFARGNYETPLGTVEVNLELCNQLIDKHKVINFLPEAHSQEHAIEVQLPFLQYHLKKPFKLVPILIGTHDLELLEMLAASLKPYFTDKNLFVVSSDFSHFPNYEDATIADMNMADGIEQNKVEEVLKSVNLNKKLNIENLATSACGLSAILTLMFLSSGDKNLRYTGIKYKNSGDAPNSNPKRVVGYWAFTLTKQPPGYKHLLTDDDKNTLLSIARLSIAEYLQKEEVTELMEQEVNNALKQAMGVFVSLHHGKNLRGCIGRFETIEPLYQLVQDMAVASATNDKRFKPVTLDELDELSIEISVLTPLKKIHSKEEIEIGRHGIYIKQGINHGTLLPQVATENKWSVDEFLGYCAKNKAHIGWDGWKTADLFTYEAIVFSEPQ